MKQRFSVSVDENLVRYIDDQVKKKMFANRSHGIECCINIVKDIPHRNRVLFDLGGNIEEIYVPDSVMDRWEATMKAMGTKNLTDIFDFTKLKDESNE